VALLLKRQGITRVRPLLGGFDAWRERGYPLEEKPVEVSELGEAAPESQEA
jgi:3-mercaptopyruvate sulfurtransferase SseA